MERVDTGTPRAAAAAFRFALDDEGLGAARHSRRWCGCARRPEAALRRPGAAHPAPPL